MADNIDYGKVRLVYKGYEYAYHATGTEATKLHNAQYRGKALGTPTATQWAQIADGNFEDLYLGDYFTINGHNYYCAGFDYMLGKDHNSELGHHVLMLTDNLGSYPMNSSDTTTGGFVGSQMWTSTFPTQISIFKADFGSHLLTWNEELTSSTNGNAANACTWNVVQASMMNCTMYWGSPGQYSTPVGNVNYNTGIETEELPLFKVHPDFQKHPSYWEWLRDIYNSQLFAIANFGGSPYYNHASGSGGLGFRAFFLIG